MFKSVSELLVFPTGEGLSWLSGSVLIACLVVFSGEPTRGQTGKDIELRVGIVQRFGSKPNDQLTLKAKKGERLIIRFKGNDGQPLTLEASEVKLEIQKKRLSAPVIEERVVLGTYRSFENAEESANQWRAKGIEVEIGQPQRWQVWAKRATYSTPLLRRLLLESLRKNGYEIAYLQTNILKQVPQATLLVKGQRYAREQIEIMSSAGAIAVIRGKQGEWERLYEGRLHLQPNAYGTYTLVNEVPLETYLRGVVPYEIGATAPYAALEAQAIIARTYALRNLRRFAVDNYQLCADTECQVYKGIGETWQQVDRAIANTAGLVLTYQNELVDALYFSSSGGVTAAFSDMWHGDERPYLRAVLDSANNIWNLSKQSLAVESNFRRFINLTKGFNGDDWDVFRWREPSSLAQMNKNLKDYLKEEKHPLANFKTIQDVKVVERAPSGRVLKLAVTTDIGKVELEKDEILRGFYAPLSTLFYLEPIYQSEKVLWGFAFVGGGFGHGVGLSQTGAYTLAEKGWSSARILGFYYPGTSIQPISEDIAFWREPTLDAIQPSTSN
ncbi:MAG: SpoIID/LytB domain-containing protein [Oscillatoriaceae bacterium SKW80]|nr:SpoIID/LytB domain-containing protein [Oscillatoriaceae bacterium SKYG93]MCX8121559.1 SpoIID/LytB domain-containing protein [Oscillatoriaceae bacterium SKW80]MDW8452854.1 SpoIID/LytB domain-containing protein [Oscillatoriaceae cyanobacterium SKYGB_i_bin93]HIK27904.1 SpoIID/LytB domain-containing protein [Oscillatoriaceae cyanobacterium M7585_C2015_266]